jgi:undecaprenyl-diphosphatase
MDESILYWINGHHFPWLDQCMWIISGKWTFFPLYLLMTFLMMRQWGLRVLLALSFIALLVTVSDQTASAIFKPWVKRERPTYTEGIKDKLHLVQEENGNFYKGGQFGFYSSHASNTMAVALFFILMLRPVHRFWTITICLWVFGVGYSRVYLGVHYPTDILMGWFMGALFAFLFWKILKTHRATAWHRMSLH